MLTSETGRASMKRKMFEEDREGKFRAAKSRKKENDMLTCKTGGAYIPPAKLKWMQDKITDKSSAAYQRLAWEILKKSIQGLVNKVTCDNLALVVRQLLELNLERGQGLLCSSLIQAQAVSPMYSKVFAALVAVINSRLPQIGELLLKRLVIRFRRGCLRDKSTAITSATFIGDLFNQDVVHEDLIREIFVLLLDKPTSDNLEVAIAFFKVVVGNLLQNCNKMTLSILETFRNILYEGKIDKRIQYMIEVILQESQERKSSVKKEGGKEDLLRLVDDQDLITHTISLDDVLDDAGQSYLDVFSPDPDYEANEAEYKKLSEKILGNDSESGEESLDEDEDESDDSFYNDNKSKHVIIDKTETSVVALRRTIHLTIQSSLGFEECAHKLLRMQLEPGQLLEMCRMIVECCAEERSYRKFFGQLIQHFCMINKVYVEHFQRIFMDSYTTIYRLETNNLRNVAKLLAHVLSTNAISWTVLQTCRVDKKHSTSSSRVFIKILFQELSEHMGVSKLNDRLKDPALQPALEGLFPRYDSANTLNAINFFTTIGLGSLTGDLRRHLKSEP